VGVLTLYRAAADAFSREDLALLLAVNCQIAALIQDITCQRQARSTITVVPLNPFSDSRAMMVLNGLS
jgi:hypothetical protein